MSRRIFQLGTAFFGVFALATSASAAVLSLTNPAPADQQYQQTENSPCVIGEPSCKGSLPHTIIDSNLADPTGDYAAGDYFSPIYTVQQIRDLVGNAFLIGIDVNTTTHPNATEILDAFCADVAATDAGLLAASGDECNAAMDFTYAGDTVFATTNNGNGYADALLVGFDLTNFAATDKIRFYANLDNTTDGREQFFLISTTAPPPVIPEPASMTLLGTGLVGIASAIRRRRNQKKQQA